VGTKQTIPDAVVLFDGVCNLCNHTVDFILRHDPQSYFYFTSLQSEIASQMLSGYPSVSAHLHQLDTVLLVEKGQVYEKSSAVLRIVSRLSWQWQWVRVFSLLPRPLRDTLYDWVARNRYRWFGKKSTCRLPSPAERARFL
jgi:predicted DCC family thiol-disulfide oxidoreductase YuxK